MTKVGCLLGLAVLVSACTSYTPLPSPRLAEVTGGYMRNGELVPQGFVGGGLVEAVRGNPAAEEHAAKFRRIVIAGFVLDVSGAAALGAGGYLATADDPNQQIAGWCLVGGGALVLLTGLVVQLAAQGHKLDAINIYNDGAPPARPRPTAASKPLAPLAQ